MAVTTILNTIISYYHITYTISSHNNNNVEGIEYQVTNTIIAIGYWSTHWSLHTIASHTTGSPNVIRLRPSFRRHLWDNTHATNNNKNNGFNSIEYCHCHQEYHQYTHCYWIYASSIEYNTNTLASHNSHNNVIGQYYNTIIIAGVTVSITSLVSIGRHWSLVISEASYVCQLIGYPSIILIMVGSH